MSDNGAVTYSLDAGQDYIIPQGYHNGNGKITANSLASQTNANATSKQILSGRTAYVNGNKITGSMTNRDAITPAVSVVISEDTAYVRLSNGAYLTNSSSGYPEVSISQEALAAAIGLTADKIIVGNTILGIAGTASKYGTWS